MGKRTVRLRRQDLPEKLSFLAVNTEIQVVLGNGTTLAGKLIEAGKESLLLEEGKTSWYNRHLHRHRILLGDILEIEYDVPVLY